MNIEGRVVLVHLHQHNLVLALFRDQDVELQAAFLVRLGAGGMTANNLEKFITYAVTKRELDD